MKIHHTFDLTPFTTLRLRSRVSAWCRVASVGDLEQAIDYAAAQQLPLVPLGDGSNVVADESVHALVASIELRGVDLVEETDDSVLVDVAAGENWHAWVMYSLQRGWYGLENLALIPGRVGAAPIQNIGAYGVEVASFIDSVRYICVKTKREKCLRAEQCAFRYRSSSFKAPQFRGSVIVGVRFRLRKEPRTVVDYPALKNALSASVGTATPEQLANVVIGLRESKLPDPKKIPNAGSFFKNPIVGEDKKNSLKREFVEIPVFPAGELPSGEPLYKLAAAWMIEHCGFRGLTVGNVSMHEQQALVLVNTGQAGHTTAADVGVYASAVERAVRDVFGITLEREPVSLQP